MILNDTYQRVGRCRTLLRELEVHRKRPEEFDAYLEAFVDCARSITFVLQAEYKRKRLDLEEWYSRKRREMNQPENSLIRFFKEARNIITKQKPVNVRTSTYIRYISIERVPKGWSFVITGRGEPVWIRNPGTDKEVRIHASEYDSEVLMAHYFADPKPPPSPKINGREYPNFDALALCKLYFGYLEDLVNEAEKFLTQNRSIDRRSRCRPRASLLL